MKKNRRNFFLWGLLLGMILFGSVLAYSEDKASGKRIPEGIYIELTRDFYEALKEGGHGGSKVYSNDPSTQYLRQISISSRFMVETNLQILKQQERIIQLLDTLLEKQRK
jgi:hypothetical protein